MADLDPQELARALLDEAKRRAEKALADPRRRPEWKAQIQFALRIAEWSAVYLDARLHNQRYDPDGKLVALEGPPSAEQIREDLVELYGHAGAFLELGSLGISPEARAHLRSMQTSRAREEKARKDEQRKEERRKLRVEIAAAIRKIAEERKVLLKDLLVKGDDFVRKQLLGSVNEKLAGQQLPSPNVRDIRAAIKDMLDGAP